MNVSSRQEAEKHVGDERDDEEMIKVGVEAVETDEKAEKSGEHVTCERVLVRCSHVTSHAHAEDERKHL